MSAPALASMSPAEVEHVLLELQADLVYLLESRKIPRTVQAAVGFLGYGSMGLFARSAKDEEAFREFAATDVGLDPKERDGRVECFTCHNAWTVNCYGCHVVRDDRLVSVIASLADGARTREAVERDGLESMEERPNGFRVPARRAVTLAPDGKHVMLLGVSRDVEPGASMTLELRFERSGSLSVEAQVEPITGTGS